MWCRSIQNNQKPKGLVSIFVEPWSEKMMSPNFFSSYSGHAWSVRSRFRRIAGWARRHHMLVKVMKLSKNVQMSCPLLKLRSGHVVVFQVNVPQISLISQLLNLVAKRFIVWVSAQHRSFFWSLTRVSWHIFVPVWQTGLDRLEVLFFFVMV